MVFVLSQMVFSPRDRDVHARAVSKDRAPVVHTRKAMRALLVARDLLGIPRLVGQLRELRWDVSALRDTAAGLARLDVQVPALGAEHAEEVAAAIGGPTANPIQMVVGNLRGGGNPTAPAQLDPAELLTAAALRYENVIVLVHPWQYERVLDELTEGGVSLDTRLELAADALNHVAAHDAELAAQLNAGTTRFPDELVLSLRKMRQLRYGENPQQSASFYALVGDVGIMTQLQQLHGPEVSFNNLLDLDAAWRISHEFTAPTVAIVKHQNPSGVASADSISSAFARAYAADPVSPFGGVIGSNRPVDAQTAEAIRAHVFHAIVAPGYDDDALALLRKRKHLEVHVAPTMSTGPRPALDLKRVAGGVLLQTADHYPDHGGFQVVTERQPTGGELEDLLFAWRCVRHVRTKAVVLAREAVTVGVGPGHMDRRQAVEVALAKAGESARRSVMASDGYFPLPEGIELAARAGVTAVIQPGGSSRDEMMVGVADRHNLAMLFTGWRHYRQ
jgi:phosphoribosylaminoimidazolecarboxamide formyltransferase/IMP cyclohydrolase